MKAPLPFNDTKGSTEVITHETGMSRTSSNVPVGHLLKEGKNSDHGEKYPQNLTL